MINPRSLTLKEAYDPYLVRERMMFLDGSLDNPLLPHYPSADELEWQWIIDFDCDNTLVHVCVKNYVSLSVARSELITLLETCGKVINCAGITDVITESDYKNASNSCDNEEWGVN